MPLVRRSSLRNNQQGVIGSLPAGDRWAACYSRRRHSARGVAASLGGTIEWRVWDEVWSSQSCLRPFVAEAHSHIPQGPNLGWAAPIWDCANAPPADNGWRAVAHSSFYLVKVAGAMTFDYATRIAKRSKRLI
jgi:hypothetical protein